jgi:hypothetical protein
MPTLSALSADQRSLASTIPDSVSHTCSVAQFDAPDSTTDPGRPSISRSLPRRRQSGRSHLRLRSRLRPGLPLRRQRRIRLKMRLHNRSRGQGRRRDRADAGTGADARTGTDARTEAGTRTETGTTTSRRPSSRSEAIASSGACFGRWSGAGPGFASHCGSTIDVRSDVGPRTGTDPELCTASAAATRVTCWSDVVGRSCDVPTRLSPITPGGRTPSTSRPKRRKRATCRRYFPHARRTSCSRRNTSRTGQ